MPRVYVGNIPGNDQQGNDDQKIRSQLGLREDVVIVRRPVARTLKRGGLPQWGGGENIKEIIGGVPPGNAFKRSERDNPEESQALKKQKTDLALDGYTVVEPSENDVVIGKGGQKPTPGQTLYRRLTQDPNRRYRYENAKGASAEKTKIAEEVYKEILEKGGRFLRKIEGTKNYRVIPYKNVMKTIQQALRDYRGLHKNRIDVSAADAAVANSGVKVVSVEDVKDNDVVIGRGSYKSTPGQELYSELTHDADRLNRYRNAKDASGEKTKIAEEVYEKIVEKGGRFFLRRKGVFTIPTKDEALGRIKIALRGNSKESTARDRFEALFSGQEDTITTDAANSCVTVEKPSVNDVVIGRGGHEDTPGQKLYRELTQDPNRRDRYENAKGGSTSKKTKIAEEVYKEIVEQGRRFWEKQKDGAYRILSKAKVLKKIKQAIIDNNKKRRTDRSCDI